MSLADRWLAFAHHPGCSRLFASERLTLDFPLPLEGYPDDPVPTVRDHARLARLADQLASQRSGA